jgi:hypothetical protein
MYIRTETWIKQNATHSNLQNIRFLNVALRLMCIPNWTALHVCHAGGAMIRHWHSHHRHHYFWRTLLFLSWSKQLRTLGRLFSYITVWYSNECSTSFHIQLPFRCYRLQSWSALCYQFLLPHFRVGRPWYILHSSTDRAASRFGLRHLFKNF